MALEEGLQQMLLYLIRHAETIGILVEIFLFEGKYIHDFFLFLLIASNIQ